MTRHNISLWIGSSLLGVVLLFVLFAPWQQLPNSVALEQILRAPSSAHWLGTDSLGRDTWSRLLVGGRSSLLTSITAVLSALTLGLLCGMWAASSPPAIDSVLSRIADAVNSFPALLAALVVGSIMRGLVSTGSTELILGITIGAVSWPGLFRLLRAEAARLRRTERFAAAIAAGRTRFSAITVHVLPEAALPCIVPAAFLASGALVVDAALGFLGLGVAPPAPSWGNMLGEAFGIPGRPWWMIAAPGGAIFLASLALALIGDALRSRLSPTVSN